MIINRYVYHYCDYYGVYFVRKYDCSEIDRHIPGGLFHDVCLEERKRTGIIFSLINPLDTYYFSPDNFFAFIDLYGRSYNAEGLYEMFKYYEEFVFGPPTFKIIKGKR